MSGPFGSSQWMYNAGSTYTINNSVRFDEARTSSLALTPGTAGDRQKFTFSTWIKINNHSNDNGILHAREDANDRFHFGQSGNYLFVSYYVGGTEKFIRTDALLRDYNHWYHIVLRVDTTASTGTDRIRIYINGTFASLYAGQMPTQNWSLAVSNTVAHKIGQRISNDDYKADYYLAETVFIDGQTLGPTSFGETDDDYGHWKPIDVSGLTFGDEGYYLNYAASGVGTASSSTIGADVSGNTNHWTSAGLVTTDQLLDTPTNNFPRFNRLRARAPTLFEGNLLTETSTNTVTRVIDTSFMPYSGKWYVEVLIKVDGANSGQNATMVGIGNETCMQPTEVQSEFPIADTGIGYSMNGQSKLNDGSLADYGAAYASGDVIGIAYDIDNNAVTFYKNGSSQGALTSGLDLTRGRVVVATNSSTASGQRYGINFGQDSSFAGEKTAASNTDGNGIGEFLYGVPSGYLALCNSNLPEPTGAAADPGSFFKAVTYTGDGQDGRAIAMGHAPGWVWMKNRTTTDPTVTFTNLTGATKVYDASAVTAETVNDDTLTSFTSTGFVIGDDDIVNTDGETYVAYSWRADTDVSGTTGGSGTGVSYTGKVNTDCGFSIIQYNGNGASGHTIPHHLGAKPDFVIVKNQTSHAWEMYHPRSANSGHQFNNSGGGGAGETFDIWADTHPTTSVVTVSAGNGVNRIPANNGGADVGYIMFSFTSKPGFSMHGFHTANGNVDGPFINTGFTPAWVLLRITGLDEEDWHLCDSAREPFNPKTEAIEHNNAAAADSNEIIIDYYSNGFKLRNDGNPKFINENGYNAIWMAFAERPEKYTNAR